MKGALIDFKSMVTLPGLKVDKRLNMYRLNGNVWSWLDHFLVNCASAPRLLISNAFVIVCYVQGLLHRTSDENHSLNAVRHIKYDASENAWRNTCWLWASHASIASPDSSAVLRTYSSQCVQVNFNLFTFDWFVASAQKGLGSQLEYKIVITLESLNTALTSIWCTDYKATNSLILATVER